MGKQQKIRHRIDAVPQVGQRIQFGQTQDGPWRQGLVIEPSLRDDYFAGVGDDVRIKPDDGDLLLIPSKTYLYWSYI
jgi:hypothetical protein